MRRSRLWNGSCVLSGLLRQSVFGRLAGYEDVNDADRLARDPAMRWVVGGRAVHDCAASASQMGRFETEWLASEENLAALADLSGRWIDRVHGRQPPRTIILDMDLSVSPRRVLQSIPRPRIADRRTGSLDRDRAGTCAPSNARVHETRCYRRCLPT